jgi:hypothetical protein
MQELNTKKSAAGGYSIYSISDITANMMNIITSHLAISIDTPATPRAPNTPATMASMKNPIAKLSKPAIFVSS